MRSSDHVVVRREENGWPGGTFIPGGSGPGRAGSTGKLNRGNGRLTTGSRQVKSAAAGVRVRVRVSWLRASFSPAAAFAVSAHYCRALRPAFPRYILTTMPAPLHRYCTGTLLITFTLERLRSQNLALGWQHMPGSRVLYDGKRQFFIHFYFFWWWWFVSSVYFLWCALSHPWSVLYWLCLYDSVFVWQRLCINCSVSRANFLITLCSHLDVTCSCYFWSSWGMDVVDRYSYNFSQERTAFHNFIVFLFLEKISRKGVPQIQKKCLFNVFWKLWGPSCGPVDVKFRSRT